jgi:hypothetical protein
MDDFLSRNDTDRERYACTSRLMKLNAAGWQPLKME